MAEILIEIDGSSRANPGPAGIGVIVVGPDGSILKQISRAIGENTNNQAEYAALICGLTEASSFPRDTVTVQTDSELLYRQMTGKYRVKNQLLKPLWSQAHRLLRSLPNVRLKHVTRQHNRRADKLAQSASAGAKERTAAGQLELDLR
ncbi:MAG: ribonuclease HI family protein [candidate division WOR-3 bacterium]|nr:MAG: ribonuclease HI family protein [candidate division WOR-3 bacterium]